YLEAQVAVLTEAAIKGEADGVYAERISYLEAQVAVLTEAAARREKSIDEHNAAHAVQVRQLHKEIASYREAYQTRVGELDAQIAALTSAANERENQLQ